MAIGALVKTSFDDPGLPEGSVGEVVAMYDDLGDGVDVRFSDGQLINILSHALDPVQAKGR